MRAQDRSRPVSRILCRPGGRRWPSIWDERCRSPRATYPGALSCERRTGRPCPLLGLAPDGVCLAVPVARHAGELLPHRFTLTRGKASGGLLSVALSTGRPAWDFPQRPALWSPDFPRWKRLVPAATAATRPAPGPHYATRVEGAPGCLDDPSCRFILRAARSKAPSNGLPRMTTMTAFPTAPIASHPREVTE